MFVPTSFPPDFFLFVRGRSWIHLAKALVIGGALLFLCYKHAVPKESLPEESKMMALVNTDFQKTCLRPDVMLRQLEDNKQLRATSATKCQNGCTKEHFSSSVDGILNTLVAFHSSNAYVRQCHALHETRHLHKFTTLHH